MQGTSPGTRTTQNLPVVPSGKRGHCPACNRNTSFTFNGTQRWPAQVAAKLGVPAEIDLWTCDVCKSTISAPDIRDTSG